MLPRLQRLALRVEFKTDALNDRSRALCGRGAEEGTLRRTCHDQGRRDSVYYSVIE
jgi:hypothetical protein